MDTKVKTSPRLHTSGANLKSVLQKAREIMATLTPQNSSCLQTPSGSISDLSDCASQSSDYGYSALHGAVISHDLEYLDFLLGSGCELDQRDDNGFTALHVATLEKSIVGVQRLVDAGCNIEKCTKEGMSPLHIAVDLKNNCPILCLLASSIPSINIKNKVGRTALHLAAKTGNQEYIKILLDFGCDRHIKDKFGKKAVDIAIANNHDDCTQVLLHYVAKKRRFENLEDVNSNFRCQNSDSEKIHLRNKSRKRQNETGINSMDNESSNRAMCDTNVVLIDSSVCQINLENIDTTMYNSFQTGLTLGLSPTLQGPEKQLSDTLYCIPNENKFVEQEKLQLQLVGDSKECKQTLALQNDFEAKRPLSITRRCIPSDESLWEEELHLRGVDLSYKDTSLEMELTNAHAQAHLHNDIRQEQSVIEDFEDNEKDKSEPNAALSSGVLVDEKVGCDDTMKDNKERILNPKLNASSYENGNQSKRCNGNGFRSVFPGQSLDDYPASKEPPYHIIALNKVHLNLKNGNLIKGRETTPNNSNNNHYSKHKEDMKDLYILIAAICGSVVKSQNDFSFNLKIKRKEYSITKHELQQTYMKTIPSPLFPIGTPICCYRPQDELIKDFSFNNLQMERTYPKDVIFKLLQGLKMTMNGTSRDHGNTSGINGLKQKQPTSEEPVELFFAASQMVTVYQEDAHKMLDRFCDNLQVSSCYKSLVQSVFTRSKLQEDLVTTPLTTLKTLDGVFLAFEYVLKNNKASGLFASSILEILLNPVERIAPVIITKPNFVEFTIRMVMDKAAWDEDKIADVFVVLCDVLAEHISLLCRYVDVLLRTAFGCQRLNNMTLSSCILVRMGLLKSEVEVNLCARLKGPLLALAHIFSQEYFPSSLASLFVSFLAKPNPRLRKVKAFHAHALEAAMLKEIVHHNMSLGKGLKRICDVLAHGEFWETASNCCDALFEHCFSAGTRFTAMEQGSSILVYFGLIKSEFPVQVIKYINHGLNLLLHAARRGDIPQSIAPLLIVFLNKNINKVYPHKEEVEHIVKYLTK